jgi:TonB family protein
MTAGIRQVVEDHRAEIHDCYRRSSQTSTAEERLHGRLEIHLRILPEGDADEVRVVENQTGSDELGSCLVALMKTWRYPAPGAEAMEFVWPFTFRGARP